MFSEIILLKKYLKTLIHFLMYNCINYVELMNFTLKYLGKLINFLVYNCINYVELMNFTLKIFNNSDSFLNVQLH